MWFGHLEGIKKEKGRGEKKKRYGGIGDKACEESLEGIVQSGKSPEGTIVIFK